MVNDFNLSTGLAYAFTIVNRKLGKVFDSSTDVETILLSKIQYEILFLMVLGKSLADVARIISKLQGKTISQSTINLIVTEQIYSKLKVSSKSELIEKAIMLNLVNSIPSAFFN